MNTKIVFLNMKEDNLTNKINEVHNVNKNLINFNRTPSKNMSPVNRVQLKNLTDIAENHNEQSLGSITEPGKKVKEPIEIRQKLMSFNSYLVPLNINNQIKFSSFKSNNLSKTTTFDNNEHPNVEGHLFEYTDLLL